MQEWIPSIAAQSVDAPLYGWGATVECSKLSARQEGVALIGDAGHGVTPNLGQGCNAALETCSVLNRALEDNPGSISDALWAYDVFRRPETRALAHFDRISGPMQVHYHLRMLEEHVAGILSMLSA